MTEQRQAPPWRTGLAKDVPASETHRADLWDGPFGARATCGGCAWETTGDDLAALAGRAATHAPRVKVFSPGGELVADSAKEQRAARRRWDRGVAATVSDAIAQRLNDRQEAKVGENQDGEEFDMSAEIRRQVRAGSGLSQAAGSRIRAAMEAEPPDEPTEEEQADAAIELGRARSRRSRGLPEETAPELERADPSDFLREAVASRRRRNDEAYRERLFGPDTTDAGEAGEEEA